MFFNLNLYKDVPLIHLILRYCNQNGRIPFINISSEFLLKCLLETTNFATVCNSYELTLWKTLRLLLFVPISISNPPGDQLAEMMIGGELTLPKTDLSTNNTDLQYLKSNHSLVAASNIDSHQHRVLLCSLRTVWSSPFGQTDPKHQQVGTLMSTMHVL